MFYGHLITRGSVAATESRRYGALVHAARLRISHGLPDDYERDYEREREWAAALCDGAEITETRWSR